MRKVVTVVGMGGGKEPFLWSAWNQSFCQFCAQSFCGVGGQPGRQALESRSPEFKFWFYLSPAGSAGKAASPP